MDKTSLLLGLIGLFVGAIAVIVFNYFRNVRMAKKAESVLEKALKEAGKIRSEGTDYIVKDGDCMLFRFNVSGKK